MNQSGDWLQSTEWNQVASQYFATLRDSVSVQWLLGLLKNTVVGDLSGTMDCQLLRTTLNFSAYLCSFGQHYFEIK